MKTCFRCDNGKERYALNDARGIFCTYVCEDCEAGERAKYRADVMSDPEYWADEAIDED